MALVVSQRHRCRVVGRQRTHDRVNISQRRSSVCRFVITVRHLPDTNNSVDSALLLFLCVSAVTGTTTICHLMYGDNLVIMSPSVSGLSVLMQVCGFCGLNYYI